MKKYYELHKGKKKMKQTKLTKADFQTIKTENGNEYKNGKYIIKKESCRIQKNGYSDWDGVRYSNYWTAFYKDMSIGGGKTINSAIEEVNAHMNSEI